MSDRPLPITITGAYRGYEVAIQVETTLDCLDKLVSRLQARGIEPLPQRSAGNPQESRQGTVAGVQRVSPAEDGKRRPALRFQLRADDSIYHCSVWDERLADALLAEVRAGDTLAVVGSIKVNGEYTNMRVSRWQRQA